MPWDVPNTYVVGDDVTAAVNTISRDLFNLQAKERGRTEVPKGTTKVGRPLGPTVALAEIETATRKLHEAMGGTERLPRLANVAEQLKVSEKTVSRVVRAGGGSDFRRWTRQLLAE